MVTQAQLKQHFLDLGSKGAIYVWGANGQTITQVLCDMLCSRHGNAKYNKAYYDQKLKEGLGKIGADCSGAIFPVSGYDTTASGYYKKCVEKGAISTMPRNKVCLVFKVDSDMDITHVGCYTGDGYVSEMASSTLNYQRKPLENNGWDLWGMPDFISDPHSVMESDKYYAKYTGKSSSLDTILKDIGVPTKYTGNKYNRIPLAEANGISNYKGSMSQNSTLKKLAKSGLLVRVNTSVATASLYYPKYTGKNVGLDAMLKAIGVPSKYTGNWKNRKPLAEKQGIKNYSGNVFQNSKLKSLAKNGVLKRV